VSRQSVAEGPQEDFQSAFRKQLSKRSDSQENSEKTQKTPSRATSDCPAKAESEEGQHRTSSRSRQDAQDSGKEEAAEDQASTEASPQQSTNSSRKLSKSVQHDDDSAERLVENVQAGFSEPSLSPAFAVSAVVEVQPETGNGHEFPAIASNAGPTSDVSSNPAEAVKGDLALAMRITTARQSSADAAPTDSEAQEPEQSETISTLRNQIQTITPNAPRAREAEPDSIIGVAPPIDINSSATNAHPAAAEEVAKGSAHGFEAEFNKFLNEPVKSAHVQISGTDNQRVDIRLQERGGALSVTVRSTDTKLTQSLEDHAPELNSRLTAEHFQSEFWTPNAAKTANERDSNAGNGSPTQDREKSGQQNSNQNQNGRKQPEWIEAVEAHTRASQKRIEYRWPQ
jgi:hypothetical protein